MAEAKKNIFTFKVYGPLDLSKNWFVYWYDEHGRRQRKYGDINQYTTVKERENAASRLIVELKTAYCIDVGSGIKQKLYAYLNKRQGNLRKKSFQTLMSKLNVLFIWVGERPVNPALIAEFFDHIKNTRHNTTYNIYVQKLKQLFEQVGEPGMLSQVPRGAKENRTPARYFQSYQIKQLSTHLQNDEALWLFVQFIYYCFIRPGELRHLRAGDILFDEKRVLVRGEISKNKKTEYVAIPEPFLQQLAFAQCLPADELIFPCPEDKSKPIGINTMSTRHRKLLKSLGYGIEYKLYSWKHTGAVMAVKAGVPLKELQMQLRHHSLDQVNQYLRQMGVQDMRTLQELFPKI